MLEISAAEFYLADRNALILRRWLQNDSQIRGIVNGRKEEDCYGEEIRRN